jgi:predicted helicase
MFTAALSSACGAVEWIIDRYQVKTDKNSGIVNDPNAWSREVDVPRYILDLAGLCYASSAPEVRSSASVTSRR